MITENVPVLGVIYSPILNLLYWSNGENSFKQESVTDWSDFTPEKASLLPIESKLEKYSVVASRSHMSYSTKTHLKGLEKKYGGIDIVQMGSSLKICLVAEGRANEYPRFGPTMEWDTAAGHAICLTAQKDIKDLHSGQSLTYNRENLKNGEFIVQ